MTPNCVVCGKPNPKPKPGGRVSLRVCSKRCARINAGLPADDPEPPEAEPVEPDPADIEIGTSEAEKARQALGARKIEPAFPETYQIAADDRTSVLRAAARVLEVAADTSHRSTSDFLAAIARVVIDVAVPDLAEMPGVEPGLLGLEVDPGLLSAPSEPEHPEDE